MTGKESGLVVVADLGAIIDWLDRKGRLVRVRSDPQARGVEIDLSATEALLRLLEPLAVINPFAPQLQFCADDNPLPGA